MGRLLAEEIRTLDFSGVGTTFTMVGDRFTQQIPIIIFDSTLDADVIVSIDGTTDHMRMRAGSQFILDITSNAVYQHNYVLSERDAIWIRHESATPAPTSGDFRITTFYDTSRGNL